MITKKELKLVFKSFLSLNLVGMVFWIVVAYIISISTKASPENAVLWLLICFFGVQYSINKMDDYSQEYLKKVNSNER